VRTYSPFSNRSTDLLSHIDAGPFLGQDERRTIFTPQPEEHL